MRTGAEDVQKLKNGFLIVKYDKQTSFPLSQWKYIFFAKTNCFTPWALAPSYDLSQKKCFHKSSFFSCHIFWPQRHPCYWRLLNMFTLTTRHQVKYFDQLQSHSLAPVIKLYSKDHPKKIVGVIRPLWSFSFLFSFLPFS